MLSHFAWCVLGDSDADADMLFFEKDPDGIPEFFPFGRPQKGADGQTFYSGPPSITFSWTALPFDVNIDGSVRVDGNGGTIKKFYEDWHRAESSHGQRFVVNYHDKLTDAYVKRKCVIPWPDWSGKENGFSWQNWQITLEAIGVDLDTAPAWGEPSPPAYSEDPVTLGDPLVGTAGYGVAGWGVAGYGSNNP